jgi:hypothetical protein
MDKYLHKINEGFESVDYHLNSVKDLLIEIIDIECNYSNFLKYHNMNVKDFYYSLFELELRLRALRDKLNESEIL